MATDATDCRWFKRAPQAASESLMMCQIRLKVLGLLGERAAGYYSRHVTFKKIMNFLRLGVASLIAVLISTAILGDCVAENV